MTKEQQSKIDKMALTLSRQLAKILVEEYQADIEAITSSLRQELSELRNDVARQFSEVRTAIDMAVLLSED